MTTQTVHARPDLDALEAELSTLLDGRTPALQPA